MSTQAPSFPISKLTTGTDRGVTNGVDAASVLEKLYKEVKHVITPKNRVCYTLRAGAEERPFLPSKNANVGQGLIGRLDDGRRLNFVITVAPRKGDKDKDGQSKLKSLHVYFDFPVLGTVRVRSTSNLVDDKVINFSFGPYLNGSATITFPEGQEAVAKVKYQYTAMGKPFDENVVDVSLLPLPLTPFSG